MRQLPVPAPLRACCLLLLAGSGWAGAQGLETTVIQPENVRMDVAQVLRVQPVYQVLHATRMEPRCPGAAGDAGRGLARIVGAVKDALSREAAPAAGGDCEMVPVEREFRRPIAYDVDYVYRGMKYRSRLPYDPGNRLRVRVSVMPHIPERTP